VESRDRCDEPRLDGADRGFHRRREAAPLAAASRRAVAALLLALGLGVAFAPGDVPGFDEPDGGMHDMDGGSMQMTP
jgi:hypothetical protein